MLKCLVREARKTHKEKQKCLQLHATTIQKCEGFPRYQKDQRQPFRFRLPWLPPAPVRAPAPAPAPAAEPRPAAAPPRPPFRPAGVAPLAQPSPRAEPPPPPPASAPPRAATQSRGTAGPPSPSPSRVRTPPAPPTKVEQTSTPRTSTEPSTSALKPTSPPKPARRSPSPLSPVAASKPPFPSQSAAWSKSSTPSSSSPSSPQTKPRYSPKREPSPTPKYPVPPTLVDQSSPSKKEPENLETQPHATIVSGNASPHPLSDPIQNSGTSTPDLKESQEVKRVLAEPTMNQNGEPKMKEITQLPESDFSPKPEAAVHPVAEPRGQSREEVFHRKEVITTSGAGKKPAGRPYNHKPAGEKAPLQKEIKEDISKFVHKLGVGQGKQTLDGDKQLTVITLAGENKGASMTLSNEARKKESSIRIHRGYRANPDEGVETSTDGEESSKGKGKLSDLKSDEETATKAYINSNVQGVNNSLLFNGSVSTMNPGVQIVRTRHHPESSKGGHEAKSYETFKADCSATPSEKLAYAPTVRRRCLGGLFMESSDSDADNPEKPRRHGCRYGRKDRCGMNNNQAPT